MDLEKEALKKIDQNIVKSINELGKKADISPAETKSVIDGMTARNMIHCELEACEATEHLGEEVKNSYRNYSMHGYEQPYRRYNITAYGNPEMASYGRNMMPRYSGGYGVQGWYRSDEPDPRYQAGVYPMENAYGPMNMSAAEHREYSRHSVSDRIVSIIEKSPDLGKMTPFEQDEVRRIISMIRTAE